MEYQICEATKRDLPLMQRLFYQTITAYGSQMFTKEEIKFYAKLAIDKEYWKSKMANDFIFNAKLNGEIIGSFSLSRLGKIDYIFVHQSYQKQGVATGLYRTIEEIAAKHQIQLLTASITNATKVFFEKRGFQMVETQKKVVGGEFVVDQQAVKYF